MAWGKSKMVDDRMKDYEDVASGGKATRVVGGGKGKAKAKPGYKHGGPVKRCRASRS